MAKLTLEKTLETSFREIRDPSLEASTKAFHDYNRRIRLLGASGRLNQEAVVELVDPHRAYFSEAEHMQAVAESALSEEHRGRKLYLPGCSAVIVGWDGHIKGVYDQPNDIPYLNDAGPGLMWALMKVGQGQFAVAQAKSSSGIQPGYAAVSEALTGRPMTETPYAERHHIGGSSMSLSLYPRSRDMRMFECEEVHTGVSGAVATPALAQLARTKSPYLAEVIREAEAGDILDGFEGNLFAGSLDSTLGSAMMLSTRGEWPHASVAHRNHPFTALVLDTLISRHASGVNVH